MKIEEVEKIMEESREAMAYQEVLFFTRMGEFMGVGNFEDIE